MKQQLQPQTLSTTFYIGNEITLTPSWHDKNVILPNSKLFYILEGEIFIQTPSGSFVAKSGDMVLIPAGVKHSFRLTKLNHAKKCWFHFDMTAGANGFFENLSLPYKIKVGKNDFIKSTFDNIFFHAKSSLEEDRLIVASGVFTLISFYLKKCNYIKNESSADDEIDSVILYIKNHYEENLSLKTLSNHANLSPNYFVRKFKERTGYSPLQFVNVMKMERAKYLIEQSDHSIGKIMEQLGFYDASHFSKLFKKYCGYSPKNFRVISGYQSQKQ